MKTTSSLSNGGQHIYDVFSFGSIIFHHNSLITIQLHDFLSFSSKEPICWQNNENLFFHQKCTKSFWIMFLSCAKYKNTYNGLRIYSFFFVGNYCTICIYISWNNKDVKFTVKFTFWYFILITTIWEKDRKLGRSFNCSVCKVVYLQNALARTLL